MVYAIDMCTNWTISVHINGTGHTIQLLMRYQAKPLANLVWVRVLHSRINADVLTHQPITIPISYASTPNKLRVA